MSEQTRYFLWSLPQPLIVFGTMLLTASAAVHQWLDPMILLGFILIAQFPLVMLAERWFAKRKIGCSTRLSLPKTRFGCWALT